ncbi:MAG: M48 family metallopeptidase [Selenomonadaceae bacterium]|nr:M48 family metallopeptidase [Selenomonadaceae bacterium]
MVKKFFFEELNIMSKFQSLRKKFLATTTAVALSVSLGVCAPTAVEAADLGTIVKIGSIFAQGAAAKSQVNEAVKYMNETDQGRQALFEKFKEGKGVDNNPEYTQRLDTLMANLTQGVAAVDPTINDKPYLYFVADDDSLNAACGMGHVMMVNRGTFNLLTSEDEIAAIVGHEMGHGQKDHAAKSVTKNVDKQIAAGVIGTALGGDVITTLVTNIAVEHSSAHKDKKFETEADLLSVDYLINTPYNIGAAPAVQQKFLDMSLGKERSKFEALFNPSDHPDSARRRDACAKKITQLSGNHVTVKDGVVSVNKKTFITPAATATMSSAERSYFVMGNLARAYMNKQDKHEATVQNGTVMLGSQAIITPVEGDEDAQTIADRLNAIK